MQNDEKPDEYDQDELRGKKIRLHGVTPSNMWGEGSILPRLGVL
jgi:hypothetical protein